MKIGFLGNTNNYPFTLALALREMGIEVQFVIDSEMPLHRPEYRFDKDTVCYDSWAHDLAPMRTWDVVFPTFKRQRALRLLNGCDAVVANGIGVGLSSLLDRPVFAISTGSDLDTLANPDAPDLIRKETGVAWPQRIRNRLKSRFYKALIPMQRRGFRKAVGVEYAFPGMLPHGDRLFEGIGVPDDRRHCFLLTDLNRLRVSKPPRNERLTLLVVARLNWVKPLPAGFSIMDDKRTDLFLEGVALFRAAVSDPIEVKLIRKGLHVPETDALVAKLGLQDCVTWLDEMDQSSLTREMIAADIIIDHFGEGSIGVGVRDALAIGRPVIVNGKSEIFETHVGTALPIAQAKDPQEIAEAITRLRDPAVRRDLALRGRQFAENHFSVTKAANTLVSVLAAEISA